MEITYGEFLPTATNNLKNMRKKIINRLAYFLNNNQISNYVSLMVAMIDKSCFLIDGYIDCLLNKNLTVAGLIVRAQIDVCMRVYGLSLVENKEFVCKEILSGKQLKNFKDKNGKQLCDGYLKEQLDKDFSEYGIGKKSYFGDWLEQKLIYQKDKTLNFNIEDSEKEM